MKFLFIKENADVIRGEESQISKSGRDFKIMFEMTVTMFDGSVANILSGTNSTSKWSNTYRDQFGVCCK